MFPSLGLLAKIECPYKDKCQRGNLCFYKHNSTTVPEQLKEEDLGFSTGEEITLTTNTTPVRQEKIPNKLRPAPPPLIFKQEREKPGPPSNTKLTKEDKDGDEAIPLDWRKLTLNYDRTGPAFDPLTDDPQKQVLPQLKAIVRDKVGYAKRQLAVQKLFERFVKLEQLETAAQQAVETEHSIYTDSVAGTYHSKLVNQLRSLKKWDGFIYNNKLDYISLLAQWYICLFCAGEGNEIGGSSKWPPSPVW